LAVILVVPLCMLAAVTGMTVARLPIDIFVQIGLLVLVGLASKNAILIVEYGRDQMLQGKELHEAALTASKIRFRPIIMTSFAFIFGVMPLVLATGAGAEMRQSLGTAVFSGMIGVTLFGIFLTPVFFFGLVWLSERRRRETTISRQDKEPRISASAAGES
jgi:multidrug efflux pump subunit AcrB